MRTVELRKVNRLAQDHHHTDGFELSLSETKACVHLLVGSPDRA